MEVFDHDGDGFVDGAEFVSLFMRMVDAERRSQLQALKQAREKREQLAQKVCGQSSVGNL